MNHQRQDCSFAAGSVAGAPLRVSWHGVSVEKFQTMEDEFEDKLLKKSLIKLKCFLRHVFRVQTDTVNTARLRFFALGKQGILPRNIWFLANTPTPAIQC